MTCAQTLLLAEDAVAASCSTGVAAKCCAVADTCAADATCSKVVECLRTNVRYEEALYCASDRFPNGNAPLTGYQDCIRNNCLTECAYGNDWACLGRLNLSLLPAEDELVRRWNVVDLEAVSQPVPGVHWRVCQILDYECANPIAFGDADANGYFEARISTRTGFNGERTAVSGYVFLDDPSGNYGRTIGYNDALASDGPIVPLVMAKTGLPSSVAFLLGQRLDPERGVAIVFARDCAFRSPSNVTFTVDPPDPATKVFYIADGVPSRTATATDGWGSAFVINALPGPIAVTMHSGGRIVGSARGLVQTGAGSSLGIAPILR